MWLQEVLGAVVETHDECPRQELGWIASLRLAERLQAPREISGQTLSRQHGIPDQVEKDRKVIP
jgi:hypothetical protein